MNDVKTSRREMYAAFTRTAVLDAAKALFVSKGFDATSVDEIAQASRTSKGAVYHHFADKREIFAEVFRTSQAEVMQAAFTAMPTAGTPWQQVDAATRAFLRGYVADDEARALLRQVMGVLGWDRVRAIDDEMALPIIRSMLKESVERGEATPVPIEATADLLFSLYCNAVLYIAAAPEPDRAARETEAAIFAMLDGLKTDRRTSDRHR
jgi:AcrR family transcriptional regulator